MGLDLEKDKVAIRVRNRILKDGIRLWVDPYFHQEKGPSQDHIKSLAETYSESLDISVAECQRVLEELQQMSIDKIQQKSKFANTGIATLRVKIPNLDSSPAVVNIEISLKSLASDLKAMISEKINIPPEKIKLIANGKVLSDNVALSEHHFTHDNLVLALILSDSTTDLRETESRVQEVEAVKEATRMLASNDEMLMELEDQYGNAIRIPEKERKALMVAMALHEKGRSALKKGDYAKALFFLLDADQEFSGCNSNLLQSVDNYALLDLDIVWCYLCLQSVHHLPEADQRLVRCEKVFQKSYGSNLERLIALKGTSGNEAALLLRLHLLQGIVLFHRNKKTEALEMLKRVQGDLNALKINEESLLALVELGYSEAEARLGLRTTNGDVNRAANFINENRDKRSEARKNALKEKILKREQVKLGKCADGKQYVNPPFVKMLVNMGYNKEIARTALKNCNNDISESVQYIQEHPGPSNTRSQEVLSLISDLVPELESAGFNTRMAQLALTKHNGDIMQAVDELLANNGIIEGDIDEWTDLPTEDNTEEKQDRKAKMMEAYLKLSEDLPTVDDDYLDLTLEQEETFLQQYFTLIQNEKL